LALRANLPNPDGRLKPGQFAHIELEVGSKSHALMVPEQALWPQGDKQYVYLVKEGKAALTEVTTGQRKPGMVEILTGVAADDVVVIAGQQKIGPGAPVQSISNAGKSDAAAPGHAPSK
jgi:membrane fusion protein (multidrug efflux system)